MGAVAVASRTRGAMAGNGSLAGERGEGFAGERRQWRRSGGAGRDRFGRAEAPHSQPPLPRPRAGVLLETPGSSADLRVQGSGDAPGLLKCAWDQGPESILFII